MSNWDGIRKSKRKRAEGGNAPDEGGVPTSESLNGSIGSCGRTKGSQSTSKPLTNSVSRRSDAHPGMRECEKGKKKGEGIWEGR